MICGPCVGHEECSVGVANRRVVFVCLRIFEEGKNYFWEIAVLTPWGSCEEHKIE